MIRDGLIDINDLPFLCSRSILFPGLDLLTFNISSHGDIENIVVVDVDEVIILELEYLPPSRLNSGELEVVSSCSLSSRCVDGEDVMPWHVGSDSFGPVIKVPFLGVETVWCLDDWLALDDIEISTRLESRDDEEKSLNIQSEFSGELALLWISLHLVDVHDLPLLGSFLIEASDDNVLVVLIVSESNSKSLLLLVDEEVSL